MKDASAILTVAEDVLRILQTHQVDAVVIGAVALAAHHYVRQTDDIDLGVNAGVSTLRALTETLRQSGYTAEFREPDAQDPLGGVIDISGSFGLLQIVSFSDRFPRVIDDALEAADLVVRQGSPLRIVPLPHLIALKLYAGGYKSKADIVELLIRNPDADVDAIRSHCRQYRLKGLDSLIREARGL